MGKTNTLKLITQHKQFLGYVKTYVSLSNISIDRERCQFHWYFGVLDYLYIFFYLYPNCSYTTEQEGKI